jgi:two-component system phosphate regulon response regulator OmpR
MYLDDVAVPPVCSRSVSTDGAHGAIVSNRFQAALHAPESTLGTGARRALRWSRRPHRGRMELGMSTTESILAVDDEEAIRELLVEYLSGHGYHVRAVGDGVAMRAALQEARPDLVLLDITMPGEDGLSLARHLREHYDLPVIMVTASGEVVDRIVGLEMGADDYLAKPFDPRELLARIRSVLRRAKRAPVPDDAEATANTLPFGRFTLHPEARRLTDPDGNDIPLTGMEFDLLHALGSRPNRVLSRDQILNLTQNRDWDPYDRSVDIRIARLRKKIEDDPDRPHLIRTVRGVGYMYVPK